MRCCWATFCEENFMHELSFAFAVSTLYQRQRISRTIKNIWRSLIGNQDSCQTEEDVSNSINVINHFKALKTSRIHLIEVRSQMNEQKYRWIELSLVMKNFDSLRLSKAQEIISETLATIKIYSQTEYAIAKM